MLRLFVVAGVLLCASQVFAQWTIPSTAKNLYDVQDTSSWGICIGSCAGAATPAYYKMSQNLCSPNVGTSDCNTASFAVGGTSYGDVLWHHLVTDSVSANRFVMDFYYQIDHPSASQAIEFATLKRHAYKWHKFSTQCKFGGNWRGYSPTAKAWVDLGVPCARPPANAWQHIRWEYMISGGYTVFYSVTVNGTRTVINKGIAPQSMSDQSEALNVHFQLDDNGSGDYYKVFVDKWKLSYWYQ